MIKKWKKTKEKEYKSGKYRKIIKRTFKLPDDRIEDFDIYKEGNTVCVLAITKENKVILTKEFRPGPEKILLELPGGGIEKNQTAKQAIAKELLQETGYKGKIKLMGTSLHDAYSTRLRYDFVAIDCYKVQEPILDDNEFIEVVLMSINDFKNHLRSGELTDISTGYKALDYLNLAN